ncbi:MAG: hypothetical protein SynsKO_32940 [Synoicihabitans sp.]
MSSRFRHFTCAACFFLLTSVAFGQNTLYWDVNGSTAGATDDGSGSASGTWNNFVANNWNFDSDGAGFLRAWGNSYDIAVFSAGTNATGTSNITLAETILISSLTIEEGNVNFSGGSFELPNAINTFDVQTGASATIGSALTTQAGFIRLNKTGGGTLTIANYTDSNPFSEAHSNGGTVNYSGNGVSVSNLQSFTAGGSADGNFSVLDGAFVAARSDSSGITQVGSNAGITGVLTVDGAGSVFQTGGPAFDVGFNGHGTLNVTDGATATSNQLTRFGVNATGEGHGLVSGTGSTLTSQNSLQLGVHGTGELTIASGGTVVANGGLVFSSASGGSGVLNLNTGGTLEAANISVGTGGSGTFNLAGGTIKATGSFLTHSVDMTLTNASTVDTNGRNANFSGVLSGSGSLTKTGASTLVLSGDNTYTGGTTISAGSLQIGNGGTTGSVAGDISNDANLQFSRSNDITHGGVISGTGTLTKTGGGTLTLSGANSFSGTTTISAGTLTLGHADALQNSTVTTAAGLSFGDLTNATLGGLSGSDDLSLTNTTPAAVALTVGNNDASTTYTGNLSGAGSLTKTGAGTLTLTGANTYSGGTTVSAGTLSGTTTSLQGNITNNAAVIFDQTSSGTFSDIMSGTGSLSKTGAGNLTLSGNNTHSGGTIVTAGTLTVSGDANLGNSAGSLAVSNGASFNAGTNFQTNRAVTLDGSGTNLTTSNGELVIGSAGTGSLALTNDATASAFNVTLGLSSGSGTVNLSSGGTITANNNTSLSGSSTVNLNDGGVLSTAGLSGSGTLNLAGGTLQANGAFSSSLPATLTNTSTVDTNGHDTTLSGVLSGSGALTKSGSGTLTLTGDNTYAGNTTVSAGTLQLGAGAASGTVTGNITNHSNVTFNRSDDYTFNGVISGSGSFTNNGYILRLPSAQTYEGATTVASGGILVLSTTVDQGLAAATTVDLASGAILDISNRNQTIAGLTGAGRIYSFGGSSGHLTVNTAADTASIYSGVLGGVDAHHFGLTKSGTGTLTLSGANTYTGGTTVSAGTLSGTTTSLQGDITNNATVTFDQASSGTYSGVMSGSGDLTKTGTGNLTLSGNHTYTGTTTVNAGALVVATAANLGSGDIALTNGGDLSVSTSFEATTDRAITIDGAGSTLSSSGHLWLNRAGGTTNSIAITDGGNLTVGTTLSLADVGSTSIGTLSVSGTDSSSASTGNLYVGYAGQGTATVSNGGTLSTDAQLSLGTTAGSQGTFNLNAGGTLEVGGAGGIAIGAGTGAFNANGGTIQVTGSNLTSSAPMTLGASTNSTVDTNGLNASLSGILSGTGSLTKSGAGTLTLSGANTYTGATTISAGTLNFANSSGSATGTGAVTIANGAFLTGTGSIGGSLIVASGATIAPGNSAGLVTISGDFTLNSGSIINLELGGLTRGTQYDAFDVTGTAMLGGTLNVTIIDDYTPTGESTYNLFDAASVGGTFAAINLPTVTNGTWNTANLATTGEISLTVSAVPEPSTFALLFGLAALGFTGARRRRKMRDFSHEGAWGMKWKSGA